MNEEKIINSNIIDAKKDLEKVRSLPRINIFGSTRFDFRDEIATCVNWVKRWKNIRGILQFFFSRTKDLLMMANRRVAKGVDTVPSKERERARERKKETGSFRKLYTPSHFADLIKLSPPED